MEICSRFTGMERKNGAFLLHTDNANVKVCFVTDEIVRVRASFDHELAEESYVLMTTAWEDRIKLLPDAALYRSTRIHHTPDSYTKRELVGAGPLHLAYARPFCRLKAPLGLSLLRFAAQTRTFENTSLLAACKKNQGKLWQKERKLNGASPLDKVLLRNVVPSRFCPGFKKGLHSIIYHAIMLPEIESRIFRAGCDSLPVVQPTSRKA